MRPLSARCTDGPPGLSKLPTDMSTKPYKVDANCAGALVLAAQANAATAALETSRFMKGSARG